MLHATRPAVQLFALDTQHLAYSLVFRIARDRIEPREGTPINGDSHHRIAMDADNLADRLKTGDEAAATKIFLHDLLPDRCNFSHDGGCHACWILGVTDRSTYD